MATDDLASISERLGLLDGTRRTGGAQDKRAVRYSDLASFEQQVLGKTVRTVSATDKVLGRKSAGSGAVEEIDCTALARDLIASATEAAMRTVLGLLSAATRDATTDAADVLAATTRLISGQDLWACLEPEVLSGSGSWAPDLSAGLYQEYTLTGDLEIDMPTSLPSSRASFWVMFKQGGSGGHSLSFGSAFAGDTVDILTAVNDRTLLAFVVTGAAEFTGQVFKELAA